MSLRGLLKSPPACRQRLALIGLDRKTDFLTRWGLSVYRAVTAEGHLKGGFNEALDSIRATTS